MANFNMPSHTSTLEQRPVKKCPAVEAVWLSGQGWYSHSRSWCVLCTKPAQLHVTNTLVPLLGNVTACGQSCTKLTALITYKSEHALRALSAIKVALFAHHLLYSFMEMT